MIPARKHSCFVIIQNPNANGSSNGWNPKPGHSPFTRAWVSINPDRGREVGAAEETIPVVTHTIRGDFLSLKGVTEKMRVIYHERGVYDPIPNDAQVYEVLAVMPDEDFREDIMLKVQKQGRPYGNLNP